MAMPSLCLLFIIVVPPTLAQFPELYNAIYGQDSVLRGVRNVMGGILAVDRVHGECMQKTLCSEFSDEIVEMSEVRQLCCVGVGAPAPDVLLCKIEDF